MKPNLILFASVLFSMQMHQQKKAYHPNYQAFNPLIWTLQK